MSSQTVQPVQPSLSHMLMRPVIAGVIASSLDRYVMKNNNNLKSNIAFGASVSVGLIAATKVAPMLPVLSSATLTNGHPVTQRLSEIVLGSGSSFVVNKYVMGNGTQTSNNSYDGLPSASKDLFYRIAIVSIADVAATIINEFLNGSPIDIYA